MNAKCKAYHQLGSERSYLDANTGMFGADLPGILEDYEGCLSNSSAGIPVDYLLSGDWGLDEYWEEIIGTEMPIFRPDEFGELRDTGIAYLKGWCEGGRKYLRENVTQ